jgi:hypothetical protein
MKIMRLLGEETYEAIARGQIEAPRMADKMGLSSPNWGSNGHLQNYACNFI